MAWDVFIDAPRPHEIVFAMSTSADDLSLSVPFDAKCPICNTIFVGQRWIIVDADRRPELCVYARDGSLQLAFCPVCIGPGVEQRGTYLVIRRVDAKLHVVAFVPFGTADVQSEVATANTALRERVTAAGIPKDAIELMGSRLFRRADEVDERISGTWPDLKQFDPTLVPNAVLDLLSATSSAARADVLLASPNLARPNIDRYLEILSDPQREGRAASATEARKFLAAVRKLGLRDALREFERAAEPKTLRDDESQPIADFDRSADQWLRQIAAGRIEETAEEVERVLKDNPQMSSASVLSDLGSYCSEQKNAPAAIALFNRALTLATERGDTQLRAAIAGNLGNAYYGTKEYEEARRHFEEAAELYQDVGDIEWHLMMLMSVGNALGGLNLVDEAAAQYRKTSGLAAASGYLREQALATDNLGNLFGERGSFKEAREAHSEALQIAWRAGEADLIYRFAGNLAADLRSLGDSGAADAEALALDASRAWGRRDDVLAYAGISGAMLLIDEQQAPIVLADIWDTAGRFHHASRDFAAAIEASHKAIELAAREKDEARHAAYLVNLSASYLDAGRLTEALDAANAAFTFAKKSNASSALVMALGNLGTIKLRLDDFAAAELDLRRQYELAGEMGDEPQMARAANALGAFYLELGGSNKRAAELLQEAHRLADAHALNDVLVSCLINLAVVEGRKAKPNRDAEEAMYRKAIAMSANISRADMRFDSTINLARLLIETDRIDEAATVLKPIEEFNGALKDADRAGSLAMLKAEMMLKKGDLDDAREAYATAGVLFRDVAPELSAHCIVEETQIAYEQFMEKKAAGQLKRDPEDEVQYLESLLQMLVPAISTYRRVARILDDHRLWALMQRQEKGYRLHAELLLKLDPASGLEGFEDGRGRALRLAMHRRSAGHRTSAFDTMQALRALTFRTLTGLGGDGTKFVQLSPEAFAALSRSVQRKEPELPALGEQDFAAISKSLSAPLVEFAFGAREDLHVWVVSDGPLQFATLDLTAIGGIHGIRQAVAQLRAASGLTRDLGVQLATPAADANHLLRQLFDVLIHPIEAWLPQRAGAPVCIVPDGPLFDVPFAALQGADGRAVLDRWSVFEVPALHFFAVSPERPGTGFVIAGDPKTSPAAEREWGPIDLLPFAREEAEEVARVHGTTALVPSEASKKQIESRLGQVEIAHLAAHAILDPAHPFDSAILLAATDEDDGLFRVRDIDRMTLQTRLVVLSCCSTGGGVVTGDGVLSLCRSVLVAGAHTVLASLWAVSDDSTRFTMTDFHRRIAAGPYRGTLAEMFRQSQLATRARYPHHSQWAPFVLWGWPHWVNSATWSVPVVGRSFEAVDKDASREGGPINIPFSGGPSSSRGP
jgi:tetratricopeptide (TPR) repeat protein